MLTRNQAREYAAEHLHLTDITPTSLQVLERMIDAEMLAANLMNGTLRMERRGGDRELRCKSFYFENREAVTFNPDGFIGFAGWSDEQNVQPILRAFIAWVDELNAAKFNAIPEVWDWSRGEVWEWYQKLYKGRPKPNAWVSPPIPLRKD